MQPVRIGNAMVGPGCPVFCVAEIGINHNGSMDLAKVMIDVAATIGADAVKFQKRTVEAVYSEEELSLPRNSPFGTTNGDLKRGLEFDVKQYAELGRYAISQDLAWGASVWDALAVGELGVACTTRPHFLKIASPTLTNKDVLKACSTLKNIDRIPVVLSTGMSTMGEIRDAISILGTENLILLHCVSAYPPMTCDLNLNVMSTLEAEFGCPVGYSGHELGNEASLVAASRGACLIERHFTLSKHLWGSDQKISLEPREFAEMLESIWDMQETLGEHEKTCMECELPAKAKLRKK